MRAIFDPVMSRAVDAARLFKAEPLAGINALVARREIQALLILHPDWRANVSLELIAQAQKPVFIAGSLGSDVEFMQQLHDRFNTTGSPAMPELGRRYTPATGRLQELMATKLGQPQRVSISAITPSALPSEPIPGQKSETDFLIGLLDWCQYVLRSRATSLRAEYSSANKNDYNISLFFGAQQTGNARQAEIKIVGSDNSSDSDKDETPSAPLTFEVVCEHGTATMSSTTDICWQNGSTPQSECLSADRPDIEVMLDLYCRRIVGGLIPVADLRDVCRGLKMATAVKTSLASGEELSL